MDCWISGLLDYWVVGLMVFFCALGSSNKKSNFIEKKHTANMVFLRAREITKRKSDFTAYIKHKLKMAQRFIILFKAK
jgi:hypothetical protein